MWMPPHTTRPPLRTARKACGTSAPTGAKMIAAPSCVGGGSSEPPAHAPTRKHLGLCIARAGEGVHLPALVPRDLGHQVRGRAETTQAEQPRTVADHAQCPPADQSSTQQQRNVLRVHG